jgi:hypothetical protein
VGPHRTAGCVSGVRDDVQFRGGPGLCELPGDVGWTAEVEATVDQGGRKVGDPRDIAEQFTLGSPRGVASVVSDQACEAHSVPRIGIVGRRESRAVDVDVTGFPVAPVAGGLLADRGIRGMK